MNTLNLSSRDSANRWSGNKKQISGWSEDQLLIGIQMVLLMLRWTFHIDPTKYIFWMWWPAGPSSVRFRRSCSFYAGHEPPLVILTPVLGQIMDILSESCPVFSMLRNQVWRNIRHLGIVSLAPWRFIHCIYIVFK